MVALYIDDVYIPAPQALLFNFNNIDRLEVERGPQRDALRAAAQKYWSFAL